jgi:hypothetical protein
MSLPRSPRSLLVLLLGLGCAPSKDSSSGELADPVTEQTEAKRDHPDDPEAERTMIDLERRLQDAARVEIAFEIASKGTVASQLRGTLVWTRDGELRLDATGEFAGQPQQLELRADADTLEVLVAGESRHSGPRPAKLVEAVVLSLTRQGLLHNLAMLVGGQPPTLADGGFGEWLRFVEPQLGAMQMFGSAEARPLELQLEVEGQHVGNATLWLVAEDLPIERQQTVEFPEGQMQVVERYTRFVVERGVVERGDVE